MAEAGGPVQGAVREGATEGGSLAHLPNIVKGAAINLVGSVGGRVLALAYTILLARVLTPAAVGLYFLGLTVFQMASSLSLFGLDSGMLRYVPIFRERGDPASMKGAIHLAVWVSAALGVLMTLPLVLLRHPLSDSVFHKPALPGVLLGYAPGIPFFVVGTVMLAAIQALGRQQERVYVRFVVEPVLRFVLTLGFFLIGVQLWGAVFSYSLSTILALALVIWYMARHLRRFPEAARWPREWRQLLFFSLPESVSKFLILLILWTDTLMIAAMSTSEQVGLYSVASRTAILALLVVDAFSLMFGSVISGMLERGEHRELDTALKSVTKWSFTVGWPMLVLFLAVPREVLGVFSPEYRVAAACLAVLAVGQAINTVFGPVGYLIIMSGRSWLSLANSSLIALLNVVLNLAFIPRYGIVGAAVASMISITLLKLIRLAQVWWLLRMQPLRWSICKPLGAGIAGGAAAWGVVELMGEAPPLAGFALAVAALLATYVGLLLWMGFDEDDRFIFGRLRAKLARARG